MEKTRWYKDAVVYQIYPRSFCDSNGDGIGDIKGITSKLDYLKSLGVNAVWLSPVYKSPNDDNGYDISDYRDIMPEFGTLEDFKEMVAEMHKRGIKLIMDLVANHTSDEHKWFQEAKHSINNKYRDYYIWRKGKGKDGKKPPNNWTSRFGGSAWTFDEGSGEFYLHLFSKKQPDLNWDNPKVRKEIAEICKFWLDLGVDGFRCDVITYISKTKGYPDGKFMIGVRGDEKFTHGPNIHDYLKELNKEAFSKYDCMTVGEGPGVTLADGLLYVGEDRDELDTVFMFEHYNSVGRIQGLIPKKLNLPQYKKIIAKWQFGLKDKGWNSLYFENHDQPRSLGRFTGNYIVKEKPGVDDDKVDDNGNPVKFIVKDYRKEAAKMLAISYMMLQGTPYVYQGQEIGMTNYPFLSLDEMPDVMVKMLRGWAGKLEPMLRPLIFKVLSKRGRDHARTPMQWDTDAHGGFTKGVPWLKTNPNFETINVKESLNDKDSILNFYKKVIDFRKGNDIIKHGTLKENSQKNKDIYCYERWWRGERLLVICNFTNKYVDFKQPNDLAYNICELKLHNYGKDIYRPVAESMTLRPYEALVYLLK
jgi:oligo-1,6-glucosidase